MEYIPAKTIVSRTKDTTWFGTDYNMNSYKGCCHGCIYCDSRSECYRVEEFDRVRAKQDALIILRNDLQRKVKTGVVGMGAMSDPYNPFERELLLTRHALELIDAYGFGTAIATKSPLVARDADILCDIARHSPVIVKMTVTTCDDALCNKVEPFAPPASERLRAVRELSDAGLFAGVLLMPVLPFITDSDHNVLSVVRAAKENGARFVYPFFGVTLRANQREHFLNSLDDRFAGQGLRERYLAQFGERYACQSPRAKALWGVFKQECERLGLLYRMRDIINAYKQGYENSQLSFFT